MHKNIKKNLTVDSAEQSRAACAKEKHPSTSCMHMLATAGVLCYRSPLQVLLFLYDVNSSQQRGYDTTTVYRRCLELTCIMWPVGNRPAVSNLATINKKCSTGRQGDRGMMIDPHVIRSRRRISYRPATGRGFRCDRYI